MAKAKSNETIEIGSVQRGHVTFCVVGTRPLIHNRLPMKAMQQLLHPQGSRKNSGTLKHPVLDEYQQSPYRNRDENGPTAIQHLAAAFRSSMQTAALELPNVTKSSVCRLIWVEGDRIDIYGIPLLGMNIVRQAGINKTPDVRTRAFMEKWAAYVTVSFIEPQFTAKGVANLLAAAGTFIGIGDGRNEKGGLNCGLFRLCGEDDPEFQHIIETGGREAQLEALANPEYYDEDSAELHQWWLETIKDYKSLKPLKAPKATHIAAPAEKRSNGAA